MAIWVHVYPIGGHGRSSAENTGLSNTSVHYRAGGGSERLGLVSSPSEYHSLPEYGGRDQILR